VLTPSQHLPLRLISMLCIALTLVFSGANTKALLNQVEHQLAGDDHHHAVFNAGVISLHDHHDEAPQSASDEAQDAASHERNASHHHSDAGTTLPVAGSARLMPVFLIAGQQSLRGDMRLPGLAPSGLDRPPKRRAALS
jgi:hypothetical protein